MPTENGVSAPEELQTLPALGHSLDFDLVLGEQRY